jgi:hypothetical protein
VVIGTPIKDSATTNVYFRFNSDTGSNYNFTFVSAEGSSFAKYSGNVTSQSSYKLANGGVVRFDNASFVSHLMDYTQTNKQKHGLTRIGSPNRDISQLGAFRWASTSAINTLLIYADATMDAGSNFQLFGIAG